MNYLCTSCTTASGSWTGAEEAKIRGRREKRRRRVIGEVAIFVVMEQVEGRR